MHAFTALCTPCIDRQSVGYPFVVRRGSALIAGSKLSTRIFGLLWGNLYDFSVKRLLRFKKCPYVQIWTWNWIYGTTHNINVVHVRTSLLRNCILSNNYLSSRMGLQAVYGCTSIFYVFVHRKMATARSSFMSANHPVAIHLHLPFPFRIYS